MNIRISPSYRYRKLSLPLAMLVFVLFAASCSASPPNQQPTPTLPAPAVTPNSSGLAIRVSGNQLVNAQGQPVRLIGVNLPAATPCVLPSKNAGVFRVPVADTTTVAAMANWHINVVRITLNEDCWLGINGVNPTYSGTTYQDTIINFINLLHKSGMYVIVDLHLNAPGTLKSTAQQAMADTDHAPAFWQSLATTFKNDPAVIFQPYNEPHIDSSNAQTTNPWACWRDGCTITQVKTGYSSRPTSFSWQSAGMQSLVNTIRATGATNPILLGGLNYSSDLSQLLQFLPSDPQNQLIASFHNYKVVSPKGVTFVECGPICWDRVIATVAQKLPVITDELGENDCQSTYVSQYMAWADSHNISYLPWQWSTAPCSAYGLLSDWNGTPSAYGQVFYNHFQVVGRPASP
jgi:hypothetical protein